MWILLWIQLIQGTVIVTDLGEYETLEECLYDMHEAEIAINKPWEGMVCVQDVEDYKGT